MSFQISDILKVEISACSFINTSRIQMINDNRLAMLVYGELFLKKRFNVCCRKLT